MPWGGFLPTSIGSSTNRAVTTGFTDFLESAHDGPLMSVGTTHILARYGIYTEASFIRFAWNSVPYIVSTIADQDLDQHLLTWIRMTAYGQFVSTNRLVAEDSGDVAVERFRYNFHMYLAANMAPIMEHYEYCRYSHVQRNAATSGNIAENSPPSAARSLDSRRENPQSEGDQHLYDQTRALGPQFNPLFFRVPGRRVVMQPVLQFWNRNYERKYRFNQRIQREHAFLEKRLQEIQSSLLESRCQINDPQSRTTTDRLISLSAQALSDSRHQRALWESQLPKWAQKEWSYSTPTVRDFQQPMARSAPESHLSASLYQVGSQPTRMGGFPVCAPGLANPPDAGEHTRLSEGSSRDERTSTLREVADASEAITLRYMAYLPTIPEDDFIDKHGSAVADDYRSSFDGDEHEYIANEPTNDDQEDASTPPDSEDYGHDELQHPLSVVRSLEPTLITSSLVDEDSASNESASYDTASCDLPSLQSTENSEEAPSSRVDEKDYFGTLFRVLTPLCVLFRALYPPTTQVDRRNPPASRAHPITHLSYFCIRFMWDGTWRTIPPPGIRAHRHALSLHHFKTPQTMIHCSQQYHRTIHLSAVFRC